MKMILYGNHSTGTISQGSKTGDMEKTQPTHPVGLKVACLTGIGPTAVMYGEKNLPGIIETSMFKFHRVKAAKGLGEDFSPIFSN